MSISVLIADDHALVREGLKLLLESNPDITIAGLAADGRAAVDLSKQLSPDIVLLDIAMPKLNGIEAAGRIRAAVPQTRIIMLSMHATSEHVFRSFRGGADGYLLKESAGVEVARAVRSVYAGQRYVSEKIDTPALRSYLRTTEASDARSPLESLSEREREVLQLVVEGGSSAEIASALHLSPKTVETYRSRIMQKLDIHDVAGLVKFALRHGVTGED